MGAHGGRVPRRAPRSSPEIVGQGARGRVHERATHAAHGPDPSQRAPRLQHRSTRPRARRFEHARLSARIRRDGRRDPGAIAASDDAQPALAGGHLEAAVSALALLQAILGGRLAQALDEPASPATHEVEHLATRVVELDRPDGWPQVSLALPAGQISGC